MSVQASLAPRVVTGAVIRGCRVGYLIGIATLMVGLAGPSPLHAQFRVVDVNDTARKKQLALPFAFYTSDIKFAVGTGWGSFGAPQEQMSLLVAGYGSTNGSWGVPVVVQGAQLPFNERLFFDMTAFMARYRESQSYWNGHPDFPLERAGSNDSDEDNYLEGMMHQYLVRPTFKYVLPIGDAREEVIHTYVVKEGMLVENPVLGCVFGTAVS